MKNSTIKSLCLASSLLLFFSVASLTEMSAQSQKNPGEKYPICTNLAEVQQTIGYPKEASKQGIEGKVLVKVLVDVNGKVTNSEIIKGAPKLLAESVKPHISSLTFTPGEKNGNKVATWVTLPFQFSLSK